MWKCDADRRFVLLRAGDEAPIDDVGFRQLAGVGDTKPAVEQQFDESARPGIEIGKAIGRVQNVMLNFRWKRGNVRRVYLLGFDGLRGVLCEPFVFDAKFEEGADSLKFLLRSTR